MIERFNLANNQKPPPDPPISSSHVILVRPWQGLVTQIMVVFVTEILMLMFQIHTIIFVVEIESNKLMLVS